MANTNLYMANGPKESRKGRLLKLQSALETERSTFISHWRDCAEYVLPRRPRWSPSEQNKGDKKNQKIYDCTATYAARTLRSGMMSGVTSPARPWFRISSPDFALMELESVKTWLYTVTQRMYHVFRKSNLYQSLPVLYGDLGVFGTSAMLVEEDFNSVVRFSVFPVGSYCVSSNELGNIDMFSRKFNMTVRQIVIKFGGESAPYEVDWSNISSAVRNSWERGDTEVQFEVCHMIYPNPEYNPKAALSKFKRYSSVYFETGGYSNEYNNASEDIFLSDKGYDAFRVLCPRWEVSPNETYGTDWPAATALGDIKQLQQGEKRRGQAIDKMVAPPLVGPSSLRRSVISGMPGDVTFQDIREGQNGLRPIHEVNPRILELENSQEQIRQRIKHAFFEDLFLMLSQSDRREITAREIEERHEEKLWALGPVLEGLDQDLLGPLIDITFDMMLRQGLIPEPPQELSGTELKVEYTSIMHVAQKLIGLGNVERFVGFSTQLMAANPDVADKVDFDQVVDIYGDMAGVPPGLIRPDDQVEEIRSQRQRSLQQQQKMATMQQGAAVAKDLSQAELGGENVLSAALGA